MSAADKTPTLAPTLAVALRYDSGTTPVVVAKGRAEVAAKIAATAAEHGVAIEENPALAEALAHVDLDDEIPEALFRAVAEVIAFVLRARGEWTGTSNGAG
jgi:flagellar biosynthesis protein